MLIVDRETFAAAGASADPDTVWAVGPRSDDALRSAAGSSDSVETLTAVLHQRRAAPLASGLIHLAIVSSLLLAVFTTLGVALEAAAEAGSRAEHLGRLRSLGLGRSGTGRVLRGELLVLPLLATLFGVGLGITEAWAMFGHLSLDIVTGQTSTPALVIPWWSLVPAALVAATSLLIARLEATRLSRTALAVLLRGGNRT